jgi:T4 RnlA family RNA ligase
MAKVDFLLKKIKDNSNWFKELTEKPYCLKIRQNDIDKDLYILSYDMINSDLNLLEVKAARGIILEVKDLQPRVVAYAFDKFFNYSEGLSDDIDWKTSYMREKIDGSIIKLYYWKNNWIFGTNNSFNAYAEIQTLIVSDTEVETKYCKSFQDLINYTLTKTPINYDKLDKNKTYIFELISPRNRIVVPYSVTQLILLGARDVTTYQEYQPEEVLKEGLDLFPFPKKLDTKDLDTIVKQLEGLDATHEGYVVVDSQFRRIKCKAAAYLACHRMKDNNGQFTYKSLFETVVNGTQDDVKGYFAETIPFIEKIETSWEELGSSLWYVLEDLEKEWKKISMQPPYNTQKKKYAALVLPKYQWCQSAAFNLCKDLSIDDCIDQFLSKIDYDKFVELTDFKE